MPKVKVTKKVAEVIEKIVKESLNPNDLPLVLYRVVGKLSTNQIEELEEGIVTVAKAVKYGYVIDKKPTKFYSFKDIIHLAMTKGVKFNLWDKEENDTRFVAPIFYQDGSGFMFKSGIPNCVFNQPFNQSEMGMNTWFIVEE